jgi:hypothetical protein
MTVTPVAPSFAAVPKQDKATAQKSLVKHAEQGDVIVLSPAQMGQLAASRPALHAKLTAAHQSGKVPSLSAAEKRHVTALTQQNMAQIKGGDISTAGWIIIALSVIVVLWLWQPVVCVLFPWALGCPVVVRR